MGYQTDEEIDNELEIIHLCCSIRSDFFSLHTDLMLKWDETPQLSHELGKTDDLLIELAAYIDDILDAVKTMNTVHDTDNITERFLAHEAFTPEFKQKVIKLKELLAKRCI